MTDSERFAITFHVKLKAFEDAMKIAQDAMKAAFADLEDQITRYAGRPGE